MREITNEQAAEIVAIVERERPQIDRAATKMLRQLAGLDPVSQKQAICQVLAIWIRAMGDIDDGLDPAIGLSAAMHHQVDLNLAASFAVGSRKH